MHFIVRFITSRSSVFTGETQQSTTSADFRKLTNFDRVRFSGMLRHFPTSYKHGYDVILITTLSLLFDMIITRYRNEVCLCKIVCLLFGCKQTAGSVVIFWRNNFAGIVTTFNLSKRFKCDVL